MEMNIRIEMDNDSFKRGGSIAEIRRIFNDIVQRHTMGESEHAIFDLNGNSIGYWSVE